MKGIQITIDQRKILHDVIEFALTVRTTLNSPRRSAYKRIKTAALRDLGNE